MYKLILFCGLIAVASFSALSQQPGTTPPPSEQQVVRINTNLIQIDVTVTDKDGKIVAGLRPEDFELYENGEIQKIANFSFVSKISGGSTVGGPGSNGAPNTATNGGSTPLKRGVVRRTIALVVDDLNLSFASVYYTRKALEKFVDEEMQPDDLVAVIHTGGGVGALQQFTSDKRLLKAAIASIRWNPFSALDALSSVGQTDTEVSDRFTRESDQLMYGKQNTVIHPHDNVDEVQKASRDSAKNAAAAQKALYAQSSIGALRYIISGMANLPGRKALMLFSDGINIGDTMNNKSSAPAIFDFMQELTDAANRSSVIMYTFDTRGMQSTQAYAASDNSYEIIDGHRSQKLRERDRDFRDSQDGLVYLADQTGGKALLNSNDLNGGIRRALDEQAGYYLLGYVPDADTFDTSKRKFNKFEVKLKQPGLKVSYRSGFFSNDPGNDIRPQLAAEKQIAESLMSPFAENEIALNINALYANDPTQGAYIRSFVHIDARDLKFSDATDGWRTAAFDIAAVTFGNNGVPEDHIESTYTIKAKGPTFDSILANGFVYALMLPIKKAGFYQYRVALRDTATGKIGTGSQVVSIPDLSKQRLTLSSMAVENVSQSTWQLITQGKVGNGTGQTQLRSTLLYDTVLRNFRPGTVLRYGFEVYDAKSDGSKNVHLETQANITQNDRLIIKGNPNRYDASDPAGVAIPRVTGAMMLREDLKPGEYVLEVTVTDTVSKQATKQLFPFAIN